uniref:Uncharacterized protein n=1 Tax=Megaviridae environmental sample TaxID=1737588 RepID=A0A5J6VL00_9VIRU|nr:MAG: hypothetical protein [Megaviridae environmental sample]
MSEPQDEFVETVVKWLKLDDKIRSTAEKLKAYKADKKAHEEYILKHMDNMDEKVITVSSGKLRKNVSRTQGSIKQEYIEKTIQDYTNSPDKTKEMLDKIMEKRPRSEKTYLKRCRKRAPKNN